MRATLRLWFAVALTLATACAPALVREEPRARPHVWLSPLYRDHPLAGRIWDVGHRRWLDERTLESNLRRADFVLLGETHDNLDHHRLEASLVRSIASKGRRPALAFEMLSTDQQPAVDAALAHHPGDPDLLALAVDWAHSGWPPFSEYRPVFAAGLDRHLRIVAADLSPTEALAVVHHGRAALAAAAQQELVALPPKLEAEWREEMRQSHCGALPERFLGPMVLAQRARDLRLATALLQAAGKDGAILVTGAGHARTDRGVPTILARQAPQRTTLAVAFVEVRPDAVTPEAYGRFPYDFVVFTPATAREDPCRELRTHPLPR